MKQTCNGGVEVVTMSFVTKLKALFSISFITTTVAIIVLMVYGLTYQGYFITSSPSRPAPKAHHGNMYSNYFAYNFTKKNASILIIVLSAIEKYERRKAIRETWWKDCQRHEKVGISCYLSSQSSLHSKIDSGK